jgi:RNA polymerase sigma-70 factor (ECF subfamily)
MIEADAVPGMLVPTAEQLARDHAQRVHRFATLLCPDRAQSEDLAQEALIRAMRGLRTFDPRRGNIESWLWGIVMRAARDAGRMASRREALLERLVAREPRSAHAEDAESVVLRRLSDAELVDHVRRLSRRHQTLISLRFGADLSYGDMAALLHERSDSLRQATRRALLSLRARLEEETR